GHLHRPRRPRWRRTPAQDPLAAALSVATEADPRRLSERPRGFARARSRAARGARSAGCGVSRAREVWRPVHRADRGAMALLDASLPAAPGALERRLLLR